MPSDATDNDPFEVTDPHGKPTRLADVLKGHHVKTNHDKLQKLAAHLGEMATKAGPKPGPGHTFDMGGVAVACSGNSG